MRKLICKTLAVLCVVMLGCQSASDVPEIPHPSPLRLSPKITFTPEQTPIPTPTPTPEQTPDADLAEPSPDADDQSTKTPVPADWETDDGGDDAAPGAMTIAASQTPEGTRSKPKPKSKTASSDSDSSQTSSQSSGSSSSGSSGAQKMSLGAGEAYLDVSNASNAKIKAALNEPNNGYVRMKKDGKTVDFPIVGDSTVQTFALTMGSGEYVIEVLAGVGGYNYISVLVKTVTVQLSNTNSAWLGVNPSVNWTSDMAPIQYAIKNFTGSDSDKIKKAYSYLVKNYDYDYSVLGKLPAGYLPNIENTYKSKKGICYDFSSILAAMLRAVDVPTKLIIGHCNVVKGLHAWNQVYLDGKWKTLDTSTDACYRMAGYDLPSMYKSSGYSSEKEY